MLLRGWWYQLQKLLVNFKSMTTSKRQCQKLYLKMSKYNCQWNVADNHFEVTGSSWKNRIGRRYIQILKQSCVN